MCLCVYINRNHLQYNVVVYLGLNHLNNPLSFSSIRSLIHTLGESFDGCGVISSIVNVARGNRQPLDLYLAETKAEDGIVQQNVGSLQICKRFMI